MMKNIFAIVIFATVTLLCTLPGYAEPLEGKITVLSGGTNSFGGNLWYSSYMHLTTPRNFVKGEQLKITLRGDAKWVYVRLLPKGADATTPVGMIDKKIHVPHERVIIVTLESDHPNIEQVSVHSGREAFGKRISPFNDQSDIFSIDVSMEK